MRSKSKAPPCRGNSARRCWTSGEFARGLVQGIRALAPAFAAPGRQVAVGSNERDALGASELSAIGTLIFCPDFNFAPAESSALSLPFVSFVQLLKG